LVYAQASQGAQIPLAIVLVSSLSLIGSLFEVVEETAADMVAIIFNPSFECGSATMAPVGGMIHGESIEWFFLWVGQESQEGG